MSQRKYHSQGSIPFSWEDTPGVSKVDVQQDSPKNKVGLDTLKTTSTKQPLLTTSFPPGNTLANVMANETKIPLPPCPKPKAPHHQQRNLSSKVFCKWWQEDPFLAAYKECTKVVGNNGKSCKESKGVIGFKSWKNLLIFSCKSSSCDVKDEACTFETRGI